MAQLTRSGTSCSRAVKRGGAGSARQHTPSAAGAPGSCWQPARARAAKASSARMAAHLSPEARAKEPSTAAVGPGQHFQEMTAGIGEVDAAAAIPCIDLARTRARWVGPMVEPARLDASEHAV